MKRPGKKRPVFLPATGYRRRRLRDAARLLPIAGLFLLTLPALWTPPGQSLRRVSGDVEYFFLIWVLLIAVAAAFAPGLSKPGPPGDDD